MQKHTHDPADLTPEAFQPPTGPGPGELTAAILADASWTRFVVAGAVTAQRVLHGPDPTIAGKDAVATAMHVLDTVLDPKAAG